VRPAFVLPSRVFEGVGILPLPPQVPHPIQSPSLPCCQCFQSRCLILGLTNQPRSLFRSRLMLMFSFGRLISFTLGRGRVYARNPCSSLVSLEKRHATTDGLLSSTVRASSILCSTGLKIRVSITPYTKFPPSVGHSAANVRIGHTLLPSVLIRAPSDLFHREGQTF